MENLKSILIVLGFVLVALPQMTLAVLEKRTPNPFKSGEKESKKRKLNSSSEDDLTTLEEESEESETAMQEFVQFTLVYEKKAYSPDRNTLAIIQDRHVVVYAKSNGSFEEDQTISPRGSLFFYYLKFSPDGKRLALFQSDNCILLYEKVENSWIKFNAIQFFEENEIVNCKFSSSGKTLAVKHKTSAGNEFYAITMLKNLNDKPASYQPLDHCYSIVHYHFSPGKRGLVLATITPCGQLHIYALRNKAWICNEDFAVENVINCTFSPCGKFLAVITLCGRVILYGKEKRQWVGLQDFDAPHVTSISFSTDSTRIYVGNNSEFRSYCYDGQNWRAHLPELKKPGLWNSFKEYVKSFLRRSI